jgi:hypothetical protein
VGCGLFHSKWSILTVRARSRLAIKRAGWEVNREHVRWVCCSNWCKGMLCWGDRTGGAFWLAKLKTEPCGLGFGLVCVVQSAMPKGGACSAIYVIVAVVGGGDEECQWGRAVSAANPKTDPCRLSFGQVCANKSAGYVGRRSVQREGIVVEVAGMRDSAQIGLTLLI